MTALSIQNKPVRILDNLYSLNDIHKASGGENKTSPRYWVNNTQTKELTKEVSKDGIPSLRTVHGGSDKGTYARKELVYAYAMWISPKFHLHVIRAFDSLQGKPTNPPGS